MIENENNEAEVEVTEPEVSIKGMLDNIIDEKGADVQQDFNQLMSQRVNDTLDAQRQETASNVFNKHSVDPDMEPLGEPLDIVDVDTETGIPVDKEETDENI